MTETTPPDVTETLEGYVVVDPDEFPDGDAEDLTDLDEGGDK